MTRRNSAIVVAVFQPTRPVKGATPATPCLRRQPQFQPTRPVKGATLNTAPQGARHGASTHAPREGRDWENTGKAIMTKVFQPTRPVKGATWHGNSRPNTSTVFQPTRP